MCRIFRPRPGNEHRPSPRCRICQILAKQKLDTPPTKTHARTVTRCAGELAPAGCLLTRLEYRDAVRRFTDTQGPDHINTGIARIKLGRSLIRDRQYAEGAGESLGGYEIVTREATPGVSFLRAARRDLVVAYDSMGNKEAAERFRREIADTSGGFSR